MSDRTYLYRHFDRGGKLLYVGVSLWVNRRIYQHKKNSPWFAQVANITVETFPSRAEALAAETAAITKERPLFNILHKATVVTPVKPPMQTALKASNEAIVARLVNVQPVMSISDVAALLGIRGEGPVKRLIDEGKLGHVRIPRKRGLVRSDWIRVTGWQLVDFLEHLQNQSEAAQNESHA